MSKLLQGKRCIVTGGSRGLGREIVLAFAREGADVAFTYSKRTADAEETLRLLGEEGLSAKVFQGSVADARHVSATVASLVGEWGSIDVLVNNAGLNQVVPMALLEEAEWDEVLDVNLKGPYLFSRAVLRHMIRRKTGTILQIGAFSSERIVDSPVHFAAAKSGLRGFTEALGREVGRHGIRVNLLAPGLLDVGLGRMLLPHRIAEYEEQAALGRTGTAVEVARFAVFMVSDEASFMTGAKISLDGGL